MNKLFLVLLIMLAAYGCKKESPETYAGDGFVYTGIVREGAVGGIDYYYAESRGDSVKIYPLKEAELSAVYQNITINDSIAVSISLEKTDTPVGCDCVPGYYFYHILSIQQR